MRTVQHFDVQAAARAVVGLSRDAQERLLARLFASAHAADIYRKRTGRVHPLWGNGTLSAAALPNERRAASRGDLSDREYVAALGEVLDALVAWRGRLQERQVSER